MLADSLHISFFLLCVIPLFNLQAVILRLMFTLPVKEEEMVAARFYFYFFKPASLLLCGGWSEIKMT